MIMQKLVLGTVICMSAAAIVDPSNAQMRRQTPAQSKPSQGFPADFDPQEIDRRMRAEAAEHQRQYAIEREQRRAQMQQDMRQSSKQANKQREESIRKAIGATDKQWAVIFPKFDKVRATMRQARYSLGTVGYTSGVGSGGRRATGGSSSRGSRSFAGSADGAGMAEGSANANTLGGSDWIPLGSTENKDTNTRTQSGWKWARPSENTARSELAPVVKAAEDLLDSLDNRRSSEALIREKLTALRKIREQAAKQLLKEQQELREVLTFHQEAKLILMGYLD